MHVGDGLGWGCETFWVCFNDECSLFVNGWKFIETQYGHSASYRYMRTPGSTEGTAMMVGSVDAFKGCVVDHQDVQHQNERFQKEKEALQALDTCLEKRDLQPVLHLILDEAAAPEGRERACELLIALNDMACIDPISNHTFKNPGIEQKAKLAIAQILKANFRKECPYCAEVIKLQAKLCKHCSKEV